MEGIHGPRDLGQCRRLSEPDTLEGRFDGFIGIHHEITVSAASAESAFDPPFEAESLFAIVEGPRTRVPLGSGGYTQCVEGREFAVILESLAGDFCGSKELRGRAFGGASSQ